MLLPKTYYIYCSIKFVMDELTQGIDKFYKNVRINSSIHICEASCLPFVVCSACKSSSSQPLVFNCMTHLEKARLELTESQLLSIKDRIKNWSTKDQVIDMMRYRYGRLKDHAV